MLGLEVSSLQMETGVGLMDRSGELSQTGELEWGDLMSQTTDWEWKIALS